MTLAHRSPIVDSIIFNLIREVHFEKFKFSKKETIDSNMVPKLSYSIMGRHGFQESSHQTKFVRPIIIPSFSSPVKKEVNIREPIPQEIKPIPREIMPTKVSDLKPKIPDGFQESIIEKDKVVVSTPKVNTPLPISEIPIKSTASVQRVVSITPLPIRTSHVAPLVPMNLFQNPPNYGKLNMLLKDPSIQFIECLGPGQRMIITRNNQKQQTNIILVKEEIKMLLDNLSAKTRIPLITGVFRVAWDRYIINAIISDTLEPRFLIKVER
jgi:hypothetical protein